MDAPDPDLATHLIAITPLTSGRSTNYTQTTDYVAAPEVAYLGIVEQAGGIEADTPDAIILSLDTFLVTVFAADVSQALRSQARVRWSKRPANFPNPAPGGSGVVSLPVGWAAEKNNGVAQADASAVDYGCWSVSVKATT